ncbi:MAG: hypothetical protein LBQ43_00065 [Holosporales bacterium]|jgi:hypothetical protein|nr:hypothetical protein [Holosporales bacterium]
MITKQKRKNYKRLFGSKVHNIWSPRISKIVRAIALASILSNPVVLANGSHEGALLLSFETTNRSFGELFKAIRNRSSRINLKYVDIIGEDTNRYDKYPSTIYSRFLQLHNIAHMYTAYSQLHFPYVDFIEKKLGSDTDEKKASTLYNIIKRITLNISNDNSLIVKRANEHLLGVPVTPPSKKGVELYPSDTPDESMPDVINSMFAQFFDPWRERFKVSGSNDPNNNVFELLDRLKTAVDETQLNDDKANLLLPFGSIDETSNDTLFGKAVLAQQIVVGGIIANYASVNYPKFDHIIMHDCCSLTTAIKNTISYIKGETDKRPHHTIANRLDKIHNLWKDSLIERILCLPTPPEKPQLSLRHRIQGISQKLEGQGILFTDERLPLIRQLRALFNCTFQKGNIFSHLVMLRNILKDPHTIIDDEVYDSWVRFIGCSDDMFYGRREAKETLFGVLSSIEQSINKATSDSLTRAIELVGTKQDLFELNSSVRTFWGVLNRLFIPNFDFVERFRQEITPIAAKMHSTYTPLLMRTDSLFFAVESLVRTHQFDWADVVISSLYENIPTLISYLKSYVDDTTKADKAYWNDFEAYETLNTLRNAVLGGGVRRIFDEPQLGLYENRSLELYLNKINELCNKAAVRNTPLPLLIGERNDGYLRQTLTLNDRFRYLKEIIWDISKFVDTSQEWYAVAGLLFNKFEELYSHLTVLTNANKETTLPAALSTLGMVTDLPGLGSIFSIMNLFFYNSSSALFEFILDKYKASRFGLSIETHHSLTKNLQQLKDFLTETQTLDITTEFDLIGEMSHREFVPSVFGRLAACEDALLQLWNNAYYIPIYQVLKLAANFYELTHEITNEGWSEMTLAQIGTPVSSIDERSLFGILNYVIASCLTSPLGHNVKFIATMIPDLAGQIASHKAITDEEKIAVLSRILTNAEIKRLYPDAQLPEQNYVPLSVLEANIAEAFYPIAGFFRFHQAEQLWDFGNKISAILQEISEYLTQTSAKYNPVIQIKDSSIAQTLMKKLGKDSDLTDWNGRYMLVSREESAKEGDAEVPLGSIPLEDESAELSVFGLSNRLGVRLYGMYSTLNIWMNAGIFEDSFNFLSDLKQKFYPGECALYYLTDGVLQIGRSIANISNNVQKIGAIPCVEDTPSEESDAAVGPNAAAGTIDAATNPGAPTPTILQERYKLFSEIEQCLQHVGETMSSIAQVLPHVLGSNFYEILRCVDASEYVVDAILDFSNLDNAVTRLLRHLQVPAEFKDEARRYTKDEWTCADLTHGFNDICANLIDISTKIFEVGPSTIEEHTDLVEMGVSIKRCQIATLRACPQSIKFDLRRHKEGHRQLHCPTCSVPVVQFERISQCIQEISTNLSFLSRSFLSHAEVEPLRNMLEMLEEGGESPANRLLFPQGDDYACCCEAGSIVDVIAAMEKNIKIIMKKLG